MLSACGAPQAAVAPAGRAVGGARAVEVNGAAFAATIGPGAPGLRLTAAGAVPVPGMTVSVRRDGAPLGMDEGKLAKDAASAACAAASGRFDGRAVGQFAGSGEWQFAGACA